jgi:cAMP-binding proteins - catabolite gene activator and regulatory subunit of cAMP-dependent protein kinases
MHFWCCWCLGFDLRCSDSYQLPFRLTHERFGELIGATRVTTTRLLSRWRQASQLATPPGDMVMAIAPELIATSPLSF